ncbi:MAG: magnesium transporter [Candidatus Woesearchaeota archaeon]
MEKAFKEILVSEFVSITGGLAAGTILALFTEKLLLVPGLFILLPGFLEMRGNIAGSLSARLNSALHIGSLRPGEKNPILSANNVAAFVLGILVSAILGVIAYLATFFILGVSNPSIIVVSLIAAVLSNIAMIWLTTSTTIWLFKKGFDPENIMGPYITTVGDIISIVSLLVAIVIV